jgi:ADP-dependent NAD(P)H-hydrate dehydratase / NAD(P)H-hydrate epimerase
MSTKKYSDTLPSKLYFAEQISHSEPQCAKEIGLSMYTLMEKAGHAVFEAVLAQFPNVTHLIVIAGKGNNGGDAFIVGRLALLAGLNVSLYSHYSIDQVDNHSSEEVKTAAQGFIGAGGEILELSLFLNIRFQNPTRKLNCDTDVIIDGLLGHGFKAPLRKVEIDVVNKINLAGLKVFSIDLPSGLEANTGHVDPIAVNANFTVTFVGLKPGLFTGNGSDHHGALIFNGLEINDLIENFTKSQCHLIHKHALPQVPPRKHNCHKGSCGTTLIIGGDEGMLGATLLAGKAALRSGGGKVLIICGSKSCESALAFCPELMLTYVAEENLFGVINDAVKKADTVAIGPGLGMNSWGVTAFKSFLSAKGIIKKRCIIDADALNLLANNFAEFSALLAKSQPATSVINWVFTPHPLEAARLLGSDAKSVNADRLLAAEKLVKKLHGTIVLKGNGSIVAFQQDSVDKSPNCFTKGINISGNSGMATAGMGDVLTGVIAGVSGQYIQSLSHIAEAVEIAVYLHGFAGDITANDKEVGMIASDVIESLPDAISESTIYCQI